jgi:hypothetical protein
MPGSGLRALASSPMLARACALNRSICSSAEAWVSSPTSWTGAEDFCLPVPLLGFFRPTGFFRPAGFFFLGFENTAHAFVRLL